MRYEEKIREVNEAVESAIRLIKAKHAGANLKEARRLLSEAGDVLKEERFDKACEHAKKSAACGKANH